MNDMSSELEAEESLKSMNVQFQVFSSCIRE
jgi:hypothetical protein